MAILNNSNAITTSGGYDINNSLRFRSSASAYLSRTPASNGDRQKWTFSGWVKRGASGVRQGIFVANPSGGVYWGLEFETGNNLNIYDSNAGGSTALTTTALYRDFGAWYHVVVAVDTTQATASNRCKIYVNGNQVTSFVTADYPAQNSTTQINTGGLAHRIGNWSSVNLPFDGYMAEVNFIDGQALTPSSFGETDTTTGSWKPKAYTSTYGTNGFYLKFSDIATTSGSNAGLGKDFSGNANYWTTNNISVTAGTTYDAMIDSPTLTSATVANYAVLNPLQSAVAPTAGNLDFNSGAAEVCPKATIQLPLTGKWYWETYCSATGTDNWIGITVNQTGTTFVSGGNYRAYRKTGIKESNGTSTSYGASWAAGDTLGVAVDMDAGTIVFYKNGTSQGTAYSDLAGIQWTVFFYGYLSAGHQVNFGQRPFAYTPPTGFVALNTYNLPDSTIKKGDSYMNAVTYTGDGASTKTISGLNFQPDFIWIKRRDGASDHNLQDAVRGFSSSTKLASSSNYAENIIDGLYTDPKWGYVSAVSSTGFTVTKSTNGDHVNVNASPYVAWAWDANGAGATNTAGSITSTVSVNATAGFSVVTYTGTGTTGTVGHGLGVAPKMIILKARNQADSWLVYHSGLPTPATNTIILESTGAVQTSSLNWNSTNPTSSVFSVYNPGSGGYSNGNGYTYVAYCWAEIAGFSKFGSYTGNGSTDGVFVYLGFRPKFLMIKVTNAVNEWITVDTSRAPYNIIGNYLLASSSGAEGTGFVLVDFLSNGFKMRNSYGGWNGSGENLIYMAFAENPFKNANAR